MRCLVVHPGPQFSVADVHDGWVEALRELGAEVASFNMHERLAFYASALRDTHERDATGHAMVEAAMTPQQACLMAAQGLSHALLTFWPDVVVLISAFFTPVAYLELMRQRRFKVVLVHTESPYEDTVQLQRAAFADLNLVNDLVNLDRYDALGVPAVYQPHCYRPSRHYPRREPVDPALAADLVFIGTGYASRIRFFEAMDLEGLDVRFAGNWANLPPESPLHKYLLHPPDDCCDNAEAAELYRNSKAGINFYRRETREEFLGGREDILAAWTEAGGISGVAADTSEGWAMGPREVEQAACELFFLREPRGENDAVLPMMPSYATPEDASEQLRWWIDHPGEREDAAKKAHAAIADRTFVNAARRMLMLLGL